MELRDQENGIVLDDAFACSSAGDHGNERGEAENGEDRADLVGANGLERGYLVQRNGPWRSILADAQRHVLLGEALNAVSLYSRVAYRRVLSIRQRDPHFPVVGDITDADLGV